MDAHLDGYLHQPGYRIGPLTHGGTVRLASHGLHASPENGLGALLLCMREGDGSISLPSLFPIPPPAC